MTLSVCYLISFRAWTSKLLFTLLVVLKPGVGKLVYNGSDSKCFQLRGPTPWSLLHTPSLPHSLPLQAHFIRGPLVDERSSGNR